MPNRASRSCTVCGAKVEIPKEVDEDEPTDVKCGSCGATAPLRIKRRNRKVKGLKGCFVAIVEHFDTRRRKVR